MKIIVLVVMLSMVAGCSSASSVPTMNDAGALPVVDSGINFPVVDSGNDVGISTTLDANHDSDTVSAFDAGYDAYVFSCPETYTVCGDNYCTPQGFTCCASVGLPNLNCPNGGTCQSDGVCTGSCQIDTAIVCADGSTTYSCTGSLVPSDTNTALNCGAPTIGIGATVFCCVQDCAAPTGSYQYLFTTVSGTCGDIVSSVMIIGSDENILDIALGAELCGGDSGQTLDQDNSSSSTNECSGSVSSTCYSSEANAVDGEDYYTDYTVVSITSNQGGTSFTGTISLTSTDTTTNVVCNGTYTFIATQN